MESSTPGQNPDYFRHVEEVVKCESPLGQLGDPLGQFQAAGIYLKSCLGLSPCLGEALSIALRSPPEDPIVIPVMEVYLLSFLPKSNPNIQG